MNKHADINLVHRADLCLESHGEPVYVQGGEFCSSDFEMLLRCSDDELEYLVTAAPDLYRACRAALGFITGLGVDVSGHLVLPLTALAVRDQIAAALAKADGVAPRDATAVDPHLQTR